MPPYGTPPLSHGTPPAAAIFFYSRDRGGQHPERHLAGYTSILQADAYGGFNDLYRADRKPGPVTEAACWAHGRRKFFALAELTKAPLALEAVRRIDAIFAIEREISGRSVADRLARRQVDVAPLVADLERWMRAERAPGSPTCCAGSTITRPRGSTSCCPGTGERGLPIWQPEQTIDLADVSGSSMAKADYCLRCRIGVAMLNEREWRAR